MTQIATTIWRPTSGNGEMTDPGVSNIVDPSGTFLVDPSGNFVVDTGTLLTGIPTTVWIENEAA